MAVENLKSKQIINKDATPKVLNPAHSGKGQLFALFFEPPTAGSFASGDANSTIALCDLPPGKSRYLVFPSRIYHSAFGTGRTMDIGWDAYTEEDGDAVVADEDGLHSAADVSAAGSFTPGDEIAVLGSLLFNNRTDVRFRAKVEAAALSAGETLSGYLIFME